MAAEKPPSLAHRVISLIAQKLESDHGIDPEEFEQLARHVGKPDQVGFADTVFKMGHQWQVGDQNQPWLAFDLFEGDCCDEIKSYITGDVRVYLIPAAQGVPFLVVTLNTARTLRRVFDEEGFVARIVEEWAGISERLEGDEEDEDDEIKKCVACGAENWQLMPVQPKADDAEEEDDDEEEDGPEAAHCSKCGAPLVEVVPAGAIAVGR